MLDESTIIDLLRIDVWMDRLCRLVVVVGKQAEREREREMEEKSLLCFRLQISVVMWS